MAETDTYPYKLDIQPGAKPGTFQWTIRKHGKLLQRSDKIHRTEEDALRAGEKEIEKQFGAAQSTR